MSQSQTGSDFVRMPSWTGAGAEINSRESFSSTIGSLVPITTSQKVWKPPELHHEISRSTAPSDILPKSSQPTSNSKIIHRSENWYELFYDLIFVAAAIQIGAIIKEDITFDNLVQSSLLFLMLRLTWDQVILYQNRFDTTDLLHVGFYLLQALATFIMTLHLAILSHDDHHWSSYDNVSSFSIAACVARGANVIMYVHVYHFIEEYRVGFRQYIVLLIITQAISAALFFVTSFANKFYEFQVYELLWFLVFVVERPVTSIGTIFIQRRNKKTGRMPHHLQHMIHRQGTFVLLISGEAIIQLVQTSAGFTAYDYVRGCLGFTIIYNVGILYYRQQEKCLDDTNIKDKPIGYAWEGIHVFLSLSILYFAVGVKLVYSEVSSGSRNLAEENLMTISASISLVFIFTLRMMHNGLHLDRKARLLTYIIRFVVSFFCAFIPLCTSNSSATIVILCVFTSFLVIQVRRPTDIFSFSSDWHTEGHICHQRCGGDASCRGFGTRQASGRS